MFKILRDVFGEVYSVLSGQRARQMAEQRAAELAAKQHAEQERAKEQEQERQREAQRHAAYCEQERQRFAKMSDSEFQIHLAEKRSKERSMPHDSGYHCDSSGRRYWFDQNGKKRYY